MNRDIYEPDRSRKDSVAPTSAAAPRRQLGSRAEACPSTILRHLSKAEGWMTPDDETALYRLKLRSSDVHA